MQEKSACREPRRRQRRASSASLRRRRRRADERRRRRARRRRAHVARRRAWRRDTRGEHARRIDGGRRAARNGRARRARRSERGIERVRRRAFGRFAAIAAPAKPAPSRTFFLQWQKTDHTVTSVLLAAKNFSTRRCSEQRRSDSSQERCGRWTDRTKEGQWIERPGTEPAARVVRLRL